MRVFVIEPLEANQRLDKFLKKLLKAAPPSFIYKMLRKKNITLNGKKAEGNEIVKEGDKVTCFISDETLVKFSESFETIEEEAKEYMDAYEKLCDKIKIVYEDKNVLIINKPLGILSQKADQTDISCNEWLLGYLLRKKVIDIPQLKTFKPSVCNRLDRNTSGLLVCGKTLIGSQKMSEIIKSKELGKFYRTFVKGCLDEEIHVNAYLKKDEKANKVSVSETEVKDSKKIETIFYPVKPGNNISCIEVELLSGRTHQIRAQLAKIGHPIVGDYKYGDHKFNKNMRISEQMLHAYRLEFPQMDPPFHMLSNRAFIASEPPNYQELRARIK